MHGQDHESCTATSCLAYSTSDQTYTTRHVNEGCQCPLVSAPFEKIADVVAHGGIPLIDLGALSNDEEELRIVKGTAYSSSTAISQVWADGLGNAKANALPRCQLKRLALRLSALPANQPSRIARLFKTLTGVARVRSMLLWMDTLCVPIQAGRKGDILRSRAIDRMAVIYSAAKQVLILDEEYSNVTPESEPRELTAGRMLSSKWLTRCWTLQEGTLARKSFFQFAYPVTVDDHLPPPVPLGEHTRSILQEMFSAAFASTIHADWAAFGSEPGLLNRYSRRKKPWKRFVRIWNDISVNDRLPKAKIYMLFWPTSRTSARPK